MSGLKNRLLTLFKDPANSTKSDTGLEEFILLTTLGSLIYSQTWVFCAAFLSSVFLLTVKRLLTKRDDTEITADQKEYKLLKEKVEALCIMASTSGFKGKGF